MPNLEDVRAVAPSVLRHRIVPSFQAEADGRTTADLVNELIEQSRKWT
jgi:MoxR-like ATPase